MRALLAAGFAACLCAGLIAPTPASAQSALTTEVFTVRSTGDLVGLCRTPTRDPNYLEAMGFCHGYGRGALDYHRASTPTGAAPLFCGPTPAPVWTDTLRRFLAWADGNPARMTMPAVEGVFRFLTDTYPCPRR